MAVEWQQRRRVPALGGWNYPRDGGDSEDDWPVTPWFEGSVRITAPSPAHKPNKRTSRPNARKRIPPFGEWNLQGGDGGGAGLPAAITPLFDLASAHTTTKMERRAGGNGVAAAKLDMPEPPHGRRWSKVVDSGAYATSRSCFMVAKAVDDDLYGIPAYEKPARNGGWLRRTLLIGCCCCLCPRGVA